MSQLPAGFDKDDTQPLEQTQRIKRRAGKANAPEDDRPAGWWRSQRWPFGYLLLWLLTALSLLLNVVILRQIIQARQTARQAVNDATAVIEGLKSQTFTYSVVVDDTLAIDTDLPVDETIPVTIQQTIPVNTVVTVPVDTGLFGVIPLEVPIRTSIPVNLEQDVHIDQTFHVEAAVPIYLEVPVEMQIRDTPVEAALSDLQMRLERIERSLSGPLMPIP